MKTKPLIKILPPCLATMALMAMVAATNAKAQATLQPQIVLRPLTSVDVSTYGLPANSDYSGGLSTIGIGTPAYLEVEVSTNFPASNIVGVAWAITSSPSGSTAALQTSPLGTNVPIYEPSDRLIYQVPQPGGRTVLRPDIVGQYVVQATITTTSGVTNLSQTITAGTYMGIYTCELCHSGGQIAEDKWTTWVQTLHSQVFAHEIDGIDEFAGAPLRQSCLQCHTTGYDTNA
ncbi:MAG TPA: hypothetical protein VMA13_09125, partial [Candidatus Saccharimonadales bacterium]|nr:hypothetical protein [Candidatus Saccharimonadales bacterium]